MADEVDTGFDAVFAGEKWEEVTAAVTSEPETLPEKQEPAPVTFNNVDDLLAHLNDTPPPPDPEPEKLDEAGKQAMKSLVRLPDLTYSQLAQLARDVAMDIKEHHLVLTAHNLTQAQYDYLETHNEFYVSALKAACIEWHAPLSTQERIKLEAAAILEDSLPGLGSRLQNTREQLPGVVEAAKLFAKIAGVGERDAGSSTPGERFVINIDLGAGQKTVVSTGPAPQQIASPAGAGETQTDAPLVRNY